MFRANYEDYTGFSRFLCTSRDEALRSLCTEWGAELLDFPDPAFTASGFTPRHLMRDSDGLHPLPEYGALVLRQIVARLATKADTAIIQ